MKKIQFNIFGMKFRFRTFNSPCNRGCVFSLRNDDREYKLRFFGNALHGRYTINYNTDELILKHGFNQREYEF